MTFVRGELERVDSVEVEYIKDVVTRRRRYPISLLGHQTESEHNIALNIQHKQHEESLKPPKRKGERDKCYKRKILEILWREKGNPRNPIGLFTMLRRNERTECEDAP